MIYQRPAPPSVESGYASGDGTFQTGGQTFSGVPQTVANKLGQDSNVLAVRVGRQRATISVGGFFSAKTTQPE